MQYQNRTCFTFEAASTRPQDTSRRSSQSQSAHTRDLLTQAQTTPRCSVSHATNAAPFPVPRWLHFRAYVGPAHACSISCTQQSTCPPVDARQRCITVTHTVPQWQVGPIATCATPDLFLQHPDKTLTTYVRNSWNTKNMRLKHLKSYFKYMQHTNEILTTYVWNT